ncbi:MAG: hypothetical protein ACI4J5_00740 [Oscillospiraceae bacterium]
MDKDLKKALTILKRSEKQSLAAEEAALFEEQKLTARYEPLNHDELISRIKRSADKIPLQKTAKGFLYSISSGDMRYHTALSSLIWARAVQFHSIQAMTRAFRFSEISLACPTITANSLIISSAKSEKQYNSLRGISSADSFPPMSIPTVLSSER